MLCANAQADQNLRLAHISEGTLSHDVAHKLNVQAVSIFIQCSTVFTLSIRTPQLLTVLVLHVQFEQVQLTIRCCV